jgi:hypothetical protein
MADPTLAELREKLLEGRGKEAKGDRDLKDLKDANKALEAGIAAIEQISNEYRGKQLALQNLKNRHECVQKDTLSRVKQKLGDPGIEAADKVIAEEDKALADKRKKLEDAAAAVTAAQTAYDAAVATERTKKDAVDALKNRAKTLDAALRALDDLAKAIDAHEKADELAAAYFLLLEHKKELDAIGPIPDPTQHENELIRAQTELDKASDDVRGKKQALDAAIKARDDAKKDLDKAESERRAAIIKKLNAE